MQHESAARDAVRGEAGRGWSQGVEGGVIPGKYTPPLPSERLVPCRDCGGNGYQETPGRGDAWVCGACGGSGMVPGPERAWPPCDME